MMTKNAHAEMSSAETGRYVTTESNRRAAAKVYVLASKKAGKDVPTRIKKLAAEQK